LRTEALEGARVDVAAQLLASYYTETRALARAAGAGSLLAMADGRDAFWRGGRARELTYGSATSLATSGALPAGLKLRLGARYLPFLTKRRAKLDPAEPAAGMGPELDTETIAAWGEREVGEDFVELLAYPLLAAYGNALPEETGAGYYHSLASAGLGVRLYAVRGGVAALTEALAEALQAAGVAIRTGVEVGSVRAGETGVEIVAGDVAQRFDAAVVAIPAAAALRVCALPAEVADWLREVRVRPAVSLALALDGPIRTVGFGLSFSRLEPPGDALAAICAMSRKPAGLVGGDEALVVYPAPPLAAELAEAEPTTVLDRLLPSVERVLPGLGRRVRRAKVFGFPEGSVQLPPGSLRRLAAFPDARLPPRLALAGDWRVAPHVEGAVRSGLRAAGRIGELGARS
ncbi:MAG: FAD-dependent oxidoreductase, partial [Longimicrobiales bacterium]